MELSLRKMDVKTTLKMGDTGEAVKAWQKALFVMRGSRTYGKQTGDMAWLTTLLGVAQTVLLMVPLLLTTCLPCMQQPSTKATSLTLFL